MKNRIIIINNPGVAPVQELDKKSLDKSRKFIKT